MKFKECDLITKIISILMLFGLFINLKLFIILFGLMLLYILVIKMYISIKMNIEICIKCDPTNILQKMQKNKPKSKTKVDYYITLTALYIRYYGKILESLDLLREIEHLKMNEEQKRKYYQLLIYCYIYIDDDDNLSKIVKYISQTEHWDLIEKANMVIEYRDNTNEEFKNKLLKKLEKCKNNNYDKVLFNYNLGCFYMKKNDIENAKKYFAYVMEHGNKLYYVEAAKKILANEIAPNYDLFYIMLKHEKEKKIEKINSLLDITLAYLFFVPFIYGYFFNLYLENNNQIIYLFVSAIILFMPIISIYFGIKYIKKDSDAKKNIVFGTLVLLFLVLITFLGFRMI